VGAVLVLLAALSLAGEAGQATAAEVTVGPATRVLPNGRQLEPAGRLVSLGNFPSGGAVTSDGRFYWTASAGWSQNDVRIVDLRTAGVIQVIKLPGTTGAVALDSVRHLAYVSGEPDTGNRDVSMPANTPGKNGDVIHVFTWDPATGRAAFKAVIPVPPPSSAPAPQNFPPDPNHAKRSWPERLAVSPDGSTLLVALNLADAAAIIDTRTKEVRYVPTGSYPYGAAILPGGKRGLVSNLGPGTVSVIGLADATKVKDIQVGPHLSDPETITLDPAGHRAFVPLANADGVAVLDTARLELERTISTALPAGAGTAPVATAVSSDGRALLVAESAANEVSIFALPPPGGSPYSLLGRIPTADYTADVQAVRTAGGACGSGSAARALRAARSTARNRARLTQRRRARARRRAARRRARRRHRRRHGQGQGQGQGQGEGGTPGAGRRPSASSSPPGACDTVAWLAAKGLGLGPNAGPPFTSQYFDVPTAFSTKGLVTGAAGILPFPTARSQLNRLTGQASDQLLPADAQPAPAGTPLRPDGPIKHVFYIVRENRTYDQVLGDNPRGDGDPRYAIFGRRVTPNAHVLSDRFPLLDRFYADSEASIDGHYWTAAADNSDYVHKTWRQNYAGRDRPSDAWFYQIAYPQTGFIFDRADEQGISWINLGEGVAHLSPLPDKDRNTQDQAGVARRYSKSDLGVLTPGGCYDPFIGSDDFASAAKVPTRLYDSSKPAGAPEPSLSRFDCFKARFAQWEAAGTLPSLVYMTLPNDHTNGDSTNHHSPRAMVADNDLALGQVVDLISHSADWAHSAIFVVEDDSQDGMDHQDAHRIPAFAISPYAKRGVVLHQRYDFLSAIRSIELILGLRPLNLFDGPARPMYDAFDPTPQNAEPFTAVPATYPLLEENPAPPTSAAGRQASRYPLNVPDRIPQRLLDRVLWKSVYGPHSEPPPPGPNAVAEP
jgi:DNA-binding beta-propeller fold protein YncE